MHVRAIGICGSDVHYYEHGRIGKYVVEQPMVIGHESAGTIVAVGSAVDPARIGETVALEPGSRAGTASSASPAGTTSAPTWCFSPPRPSTARSRHT